MCRLRLYQYVARLTEKQTPVFFVYHSWTIGLLAVKLGFQVLAGAWADPGAQQPDEATWCMRPVRRLAQNVRRMKAVGVTRVSFADAFKTVLLPVITFWGVAVSVPYVLSRGLLPRMPFVPVPVLHFAFAYGWILEANLVTAVVLLSELGLRFRQYQAKIRDQHYLLHRELINMPTESVA